ncbi:MAG: alpha/beta fold hydrolase [Acidobacteria bacterium]|nr:MAG: alpha/beta fold hydrolase [Acidobacteriota bacterium]
MPRSGVRVPPGPLFFIHGWGFSSKVLASFPSVDLPFHGRSKLSYSDPWSLARELALIAPEGSTLIGWSMGGSLALMMAYMFPEKFRGLLLIGATAHFGGNWQERNLRGFILRLKREGTEFLKTFRRLAYEREFEDCIELEGAEKLLRDYITLNIKPIVPNIRQRVFLLHGIRDPIVPFRSALSLYNLLKRSKLIPFLGGHFPRNESLIFEVLKGMEEL